MTRKQKAIFLDRDGVINQDYGFVHDQRDFEFCDGIFDLARAACSNNYKIIVITNQSGIGRGYYSEAQFNQLTAWMCGKFANEGAPIERVYFSPFHPTKGIGNYRKDDFSRKPHPGMLIQAQKEFGLSLENSILVGDKYTDIQAGISAGIGLNILVAPYEISNLKDLSCQIVKSLSEVPQILQNFSENFS